MVAVPRAEPPQQARQEPAERTMALARVRHPFPLVKPRVVRRRTVPGEISAPKPTNLPPAVASVFPGRGTSARRIQTAATRWSASSTTQSACATAIRWELGAKRLAPRHPAPPTNAVGATDTASRRRAMPASIVRRARFATRRAPRVTSMAAQSRDAISRGMRAPRGIAAMALTAPMTAAAPWFRVRRVSSAPRIPTAAADRTGLTSANAGRATATSTAIADTAYSDCAGTGCSCVRRPLRPDRAPVLDDGGPMARRLLRITLQHAPRSRWSHRSER